MDWILTHKYDLYVIFTSVVTIASTIAALTPSNVDNAAIASVKKVVDILALNFGFAKK
jgi:hypothetical protein